MFKTPQTFRKTYSRSVGKRMPRLCKKLTIRLLTQTYLRRCQISMMKFFSCQLFPQFCRLAESYTAQNMKFSIKEFFSKCDQICSFLRIWSDLLKKSLIENFIFCGSHFVHLFKTPRLPVQGLRYKVRTPQDF